MTVSSLKQRKMIHFSKSFQCWTNKSKVRSCRHCYALITSQDTAYISIKKLLLQTLGNIQQLRGPNFTQFWPLTRKWSKLSNYPPACVYNCGYFANYLIFVHRIKCERYTDHLPTSFCLCTYVATGWPLTVTSKWIWPYFCEPVD